LVEDVDGLGVVAQLVDIDPVVRAEGLSLRPDFVEGVGVIECAGFHDHSDVRGVVDVVEGVGVEDHQIGELANLERAQIFVGAKEMRSVEAGHFEHPWGR